MFLSDKNEQMLRELRFGDVVQDRDTGAMGYAGAITQYMNGDYSVIASPIVQEGSFLKLSLYRSSIHIPACMVDVLHRNNHPRHCSDRMLLWDDNVYPIRTEVAFKLDRSLRGRVAAVHMSSNGITRITLSKTHGSFEPPVGDIGYFDPVNTSIDAIPLIPNNEIGDILPGDKVNVFGLPDDFTPTVRSLNLSTDMHAEVYIPVRRPIFTNESKEIRLSWEWLRPIHSIAANPYLPEGWDFKFNISDYVVHKYNDLAGVVIRKSLSLAHGEMYDIYTGAGRMHRITVGSLTYDKDQSSINRRALGITVHGSTVRKDNGTTITEFSKG